MLSTLAGGRSSKGRIWDMKKCVYMDAAEVFICLRALRFLGHRLHRVRAILRNSKNGDP
jgi:hypothetical protein